MTKNKCDNNKCTFNAEKKGTDNRIKPQCGSCNHVVVSADCRHRKKDGSCPFERDLTFGKFGGG